MTTGRKTWALAGARCALLLALAGCIWPEGDGRVFVTSDPPGAAVFVDGESTGKTTPAELELSGFFGDDHKILVKKRGYEPEERTVRHYRKWRTSQWYDGVVDASTPAFPVFWTVGDLLFPIEVRWAYVPHDLFIRLFPEGTFHPKPGSTVPTVPDQSNRSKR